MSGKLYIPLINQTGIGDAPVPVPVPAPEPPVEPHVPVSCGMSIQEQAIFDLLAGHPEQRRKNIKCDVRLVRAARAKALDMGTRDYLAHTDPSGETPNALAKRYGYPLPYGDGNNIESLGGGYIDADSVFAGWLNSDGHRRHVLGEIAFYAEQEYIGIGFAKVPGSRYGAYWVALTAP